MGHPTLSESRRVGCQELSHRLTDYVLGEALLLKHGSVITQLVRYTALLFLEFFFFFKLR